MISFQTIQVVAQSKNVMIWVLFWICILVLIFCMMFKRYKLSCQRIQECFNSFNRPLLVIAHPDDESMFFIPIIQHMLKHNKDLHILCYTTGNFDGLGAIRKPELFEAASRLGIDSSKVTVLDDASYLDGMKAVWDMEKAVRVLEDHISQNNIDCLLTFDGYGVSGHPNHISCFHICSQYLVESNHHVPLLILESVSLMRKYIGVLDIFASLLSPNSLFVYYNHIQMNVRAMKAHKSQFVWFRWLFVLFSRYTTMNTLHLFK